MTEEVYILRYKDSLKEAQYILEQESGFSIYEEIDKTLATPLQMQDWDINNQRSTEDATVSKTLEFSYDDWCIAQAARYLGHDDVYKEYMKRSEYYRFRY